MYKHTFICRRGRDRSDGVRALLTVLKNDSAFVAMENAEVRREKCTHTPRLFLRTYIFAPADLCGSLYSSIAVRVPETETENLPFITTTRAGVVQ